MVERKSSSGVMTAVTAALLFSFRAECLKKKKKIPAFCAGTIAGLDNTSPIVSVMFCLSREGLSAAVFVFVKSIFCRWLVWFFGLCGSETAGIWRRTFNSAELKRTCVSLWRDVRLQMIRIDVSWFVIWNRMELRIIYDYKYLKSL